MPFPILEKGILPSSMPMRNLHEKYPDDADIATIFGESYMNTTRWDYWEADGAAKPGTAEAQTAFESAMRFRA